MNEHIFPLALHSLYNINVVNGAIYFIAGIIAITEGYDRRIYHKRFMFWSWCLFLALPIFMMQFFGYLGASKFFTLIGDIFHNNNVLSRSFVIILLVSGSALLIALKNINVLSSKYINLFLGSAFFFGGLYEVNNHVSYVINQPTVHYHSISTIILSTSLSLTGLFFYCELFFNKQVFRNLWGSCLAFNGLLNIVLQPVFLRPFQFKQPDFNYIYHITGSVVVVLLLTACITAGIHYVYKMSSKHR